LLKKNAFCLALYRGFRERRLELLSVVALGLLASPTLVLTDPSDRLSAAWPTPIERLSVMATAAVETPRPDALRYPFFQERLSVEWIHPLAGYAHELPQKPDRRFGAHRPREPRPECGGGHCGVDLGGTIGTPVRAILKGIVTRIEQNPNRSSGRYVRIRHFRGIESEYMHLDSFAPNLKRGDLVNAGAVIGHLGRSGIHDSEPHLHFAVSKAGENGRQIFVDPEPMLRRATWLPGD
jgi:murein DD-endopeptidase MepM/ murein hydrolase activator NlpD